MNKALLAHFYAVKHWDIPDGFLCPPVPGRADYIHHLADLLAGDSGEVPKDATILDIGTGANLIYPLIGAHEYGWRFTGSEINPQAFASAQAIINGNPGLTRQIRLRRQKESRAIFHGVIHKNETYDATLCNPPFHDSAESARAGGERKRRNLGLGAESGLNFGGQQQELWCEGGEVAFISQMIRESQAFARQVKWFTSLVSRGDNLPPLYRLLTEVGAVKVVKKEMAQGKSKVALSPELYGRRQTPSSILTLLGGRAVGARHRQLLPGLYRRANPGAVEVLFHLGVEGKTHRPLLQRQGGEADA